MMVRTTLLPGDPSSSCATKFRSIFSVSMGSRPRRLSDEYHPHLVVLHLIRVQIDFRHFFDNEEEDVRFVHPLHFRTEFEVLEYATHVCGKAIDVVCKMTMDVVRVTLQFLEIELRVIVEAVTRDLVQRAIQSIVFKFPAFATLELLQHLGLGVRQHAIEAAQYNEWQHHTLILRRAIRTAQ